MGGVAPSRSGETSVSARLRPASTFCLPSDVWRTSGRSVAEEFLIGRLMGNGTIAISSYSCSYI